MLERKNGTSKETKNQRMKNRMKKERAKNKTKERIKEEIKQNRTKTIKGNYKKKKTEEIQIKKY